MAGSGARAGSSGTGGCWAKPMHVCMFGVSRGSGFCIDTISSA